MVVAIWGAAVVSALVLRRGIRWHISRWWAVHVRSLRSPDRPRSRRLLVDPLTPIIQSRRLFT